MLSKTSCSLVVRTDSMEAVVDDLVKRGLHLQAIEAPELDSLLTTTTVDAINYQKSWDQAKDDPWIVFHTSGTTGHPKPIVYTHRMMAIPDTAASLKDIAETHGHHYAKRRWYTPMPMLHVCVLPPASKHLLTCTVCRHANGAIYDIFNWVCSCPWARCSSPNSGCRHICVAAR